MTQPNPGTRPPERARAEGWIGPTGPRQMLREASEVASGVASGATVAGALLTAGGMTTVASNAIAGYATGRGVLNTVMNPPIGSGFELLAAGATLLAAGQAIYRLNQPPRSTLSEQMLQEAALIVLGQSDEPHNIGSMDPGQGIQASHILMALQNGTAPSEMVEATAGATNARELAAMAVGIVREHAHRA
jgi:hypothetical protein